MPDYGQFCTVVCAVIDRTSTPTEVSIACAGHPPPLLCYRDGRIEAVGCAGTLLGAFPSVAVTGCHITVGPGDTLVFYTDGATAAGEDEALRAALGGAARLDADGVADVVRAVADRVGHDDDVAVVAVRFLT